MISVCMATYNGETYLKEQIDSILKQISDDDELIISDDRSTDRTVEIIQSYSDKRIKLLRHDRKMNNTHFKNGYYCSNNFSNAIENAKGDFIFLSDQDDVWCENKVEKVKKELLYSDMVLTDFSVIDKNGQIIESQFFKKNPVTLNWFHNLNRGVYFGCCMAVKKDAIKSYVPVPHSIGCYDTWFGVLLSLHHKRISFIEEPLILYRRHGSNISSATQAKSVNPLYFKIFWRLQFLLTLLCAEIHLMRKLRRLQCE